MKTTKTQHFILFTLGKWYEEANKKITYYVTDTIFLEKGEEIPEKDLTNSQNYLIIISCWPPGKDSKRIAIMSELTINQ